MLQVLIARTDAAQYVTASNMMAWRCIARKDVRPADAAGPFSHALTTAQYVITSGTMAWRRIARKRCKAC